MQTIHDGQCGLCKHFGENEPDTQKLVQIRTTKQAPEDLTESCGHPSNKDVHLVVTPLSGCQGFEAAAAA